MTDIKREKSPDADALEEDELQYSTGSATVAELDEKFPNRPRNHSRTFLFSELYQNLFNPLNENKKQPTGPGPARSRAKAGPGGRSKLSPHEQRRAIIERFIRRWRAEVGNDFYPALRLILPDKDRDRDVYGLKENAIGKLLVKIMRIDKDSEDGYNLLHWKLPGQSTASRLAGDFAGRCYEVLSKRPMRADPGDMRLAEVNALLDRMSAAAGEAEMLPLWETFYRRMNAEELMWLVRIVLKQMKVGATERTFLDIWHPDGDALFSVSSSLRRVCWELWDPQLRLEGDDRASVTLMECFQPQLAQFQMPASFQRMVDYLQPTEEDPEFWIEEKLDGERMQMHMMADDDMTGGMTFRFWSRKAKDYTYLYGNGFHDGEAALTQYLVKAFDDGVRSLILDGEMITWDMDTDKIAPFGTLKTAALREKGKVAENGADIRPVYRVFDILFLNDKDLTSYTLRDRRRALAAAVRPVHRRLEIHDYTAATSAEAIEPALRTVVASASEGLVLKNPRSRYRLNSRNDDWLKVKPEYMSEFGESLDCVVVGGYYGSGRRGGTISSFLCGLRADENRVAAGASPEKHWSFFKVGGGFRAEDYAQMRHALEGRWREWDPRQPPTRYVELAGGEGRQYERPDVWVRPSESVVISAKAASIGDSDRFALGWTLRFPRFRRLRLDRAWDSAMSIAEFEQLRRRVRDAEDERKMSVEDRRRGRAGKRRKREVVIAGTEPPGEAEARFADAEPGAAGAANAANAAGPAAKVFEGLEFCVMSEAGRPTRRSKAQLEALVKAHGGRVAQRAEPGSGMVIVSDKKVVHVASLLKAHGGAVDIVRPKWLLDCLATAESGNGGGGGGGGGGYLLPFEENHLFHATEALRELAKTHTDMYGDSYARDVGAEELGEILRGMPKAERADDDDDDDDDDGLDGTRFLHQVLDRGHDVGRLKTLAFRGCRAHFAVPEGGEDLVAEVRRRRLENYVRYGGGEVVGDIADKGVTHVVVVVVVMADDGRSARVVAADARARISSRRTVPRVVGPAWVEECWKEGTAVDEEAYGVK